MEISKTSHQVMPSLKNILIIGNGGRENSLAWGLSKSIGIEKLFVSPGNGGTQDFQNCFPLDIELSNVEDITFKCKANKVDLVIIGPEAPLAEGLADKIRNKNIPVFGPGKEGAQLEASKDWAKKLMNQAGIPTAKHWTIKNKKEALDLLNELKKPLVVKCNGLAGGKGVAVPKTFSETIKAIEDVFQGKFGEAGETVILEEILTGPEVSIFALCDGNRMIILPPAQDHKRLKDGDIGPNTGGMGAYAPAPLVSKAQLENIKALILDPTLKALKSRGIDYRGVIYAGLMITTSGPKVIEFNCRFGDPECQTLIPLLGNELAEVLQGCALGKLNECSDLSIKEGCSVCIVAAAKGYPESPRKNDLITIQLESTNSIQLFHAGTRINSEGNLITSGGRVLSVVAQGESFDKAFATAYKAIEQIKFSGITYRRDIGHQVRGSIPSSSD